MSHLLAQLEPLENIYLPGQKLGGSQATFATLISPLIRDVLVGTAVVSFGVIVIAGFNFITSSGDKQRIQQSTSMITYGLIGLVVAVAAFAITQIVGAIGGFNLLQPGI